jgi:hypothetical protein
VPTFSSTPPGIAGDRAPMCVPQSGQKSRVTGFARSVRLNFFGVPFVYVKPDSGIAITTFGCPPEMYWHSRQWHWPLNIGSPVARKRSEPQ